MSQEEIPKFSSAGHDAISMYTLFRVSGTW